MTTEAMMKLHARKEAVDIGRIGLQAGVYAGLTPLDIRSLEDTVVRYTVAQALLDNLAQSESSLIVRDILPDKDLLDAAGAVIVSRDWRQPVSGNYASATGAPATKETLYLTSRSSNNDRKVISFYGLRLVGTGPFRASSALKINSLIWSRPGVKTIDIWHIQILETIDGQALFGRTPLMFKRGDDAQLEAVPNASVPVGASKFDNIAFLGKVVEASGNTMVG
jgi:hypothetical protein